MTSGRSSIVHNYYTRPPKGQQYKCEACGLETIGFWKSFLLSITGRRQPNRTTRWHYLYDVEWKNHPKYSKEPYYSMPYDRYKNESHRYFNQFYYLCAECFLKAHEEEKQLERQMWSEVEKEKRRLDEEIANSYWEKPTGGFLSGPEIKVMKWFKKNEGKKVEINYWSSEGKEYCKNVEWIIERPYYSMSIFHFPGKLRLPRDFKTARIEESQMNLYFEYGRPSLFEESWTIKLI